MRASRSAVLTLVVAATLLLGACGSPGSGGGQAETQAANPSSSAGSAALVACDPVPGDKLVVLTDDKGLQNADNIIPAVNKKVADANPAVLESLNKVSAALTTAKLIALNKAVDIDHRTSSDVAKEFVSTENLAASDSSAGAGTSLTVGAPNFSEGATLAEVYAAVLRSAGFKANTQTVGNRETYLPALTGGTLAVVPEYAATLADFLNNKANGADAKSVASSDVDATVKALTPLATAAGLTVGTASSAQDENAFAVTDKFAEKYNVKTLTDLATTCKGLVMAGPAECPKRPFCQLGLENTYGMQFADFKSYDFGLIDQAVLKGDAAIGLVLSSDGALAS